MKNPYHFKNVQPQVDEEVNSASMSVNSTFVVVHLKIEGQNHALLIERSELEKLQHRKGDVIRKVYIN